MFIYIKSLNGNKSEINVDDDATVRQVKLILQEKEGIPAEQLRLIFKGKLLNDQDKLKERGFSHFFSFFFFFTHKICFKNNLPFPFQKKTYIFARNRNTQRNNHTHKHTRANTHAQIHTK